MKAKDIRNGSVIMFKGAPHSVMTFTHRTPGNLRAFVQARLRNLATGVQLETKFSAQEEIETANVFTEPATFLYEDAVGFHFMNSSSYEEVVLSPELVGDNKFYLTDGMAVEVSLFEEQPIAVSLPKTTVLTVVETEPEMRGATASNSPKPAKMNTGLTVSVPAFIKQGERIVVNTENGSYLSRAD